MNGGLCPSCASSGVAGKLGSLLAATDTAWDLLWLLSLELELFVE